MPLQQFVEQYQDLGAQRASEPRWLLAKRQAAIARLSSEGLPTARLEDWKYTNVAPLLKTSFTGTLDATAKVDAATADAQTIAGCARLVLLNGRVVDGLSLLRALPSGVVVNSLSRALSNGDSQLLERHFGAALPSGEPGATVGFQALNTALAVDGVVVRLGPGTVLEQPLQLVHIVNADEPTAVHPRVLVVAERSSQATVIETYCGPSSVRYLTNAVTELIVDEGAYLEHLKIQAEGEAALHVATVQALQARDSQVSSHSFSFGAAMARNDINSVLSAEGTHCALNGLFLAGEHQHVDHHTVVDHAKPNSTSNELYKGILSGRAKGVFNGKIFVRKDAQKIDAIQNNKNLLLSDDATINTKPQLEIFADDVRCTHGATVGQLDENALFYLRSRGLGAEEARRLLVHAFAAEVLARVKQPTVRDHLETILTQRLHRA